MFDDGQKGRVVTGEGVGRNEHAGEAINRKKKCMGSYDVGQISREGTGLMSAKG